MRAACLTVAVLAACGSGDGKRDAATAAADAHPADAAPSDGPVTLSCAELQARWRARVEAMPTDCEVDGDCLAPGDTADSEVYCDCGPTLASDCTGQPVNRAAYVADVEAAALFAEFHARCLVTDCKDLECLCDCEPGLARCSAGRCTAVPDGCCLCPPDAGP